jgi:hypothetical protein
MEDDGLQPVDREADIGPPLASHYIIYHKKKVDHFTSHNQKHGIYTHLSVGLGNHPDSRCRDTW